MRKFILAPGNTTDRTEAYRSSAAAIPTSRRCSRSAASRANLVLGQTPGVGACLWS
jgi:hypothetical protein